MSNTKSISDVASKEDWLNMTSQYKGITDFIEKCETPITIAIQGDWGIGKTSAMEIIQGELKLNKNNPCIWFKTWQFSVINNGCNIIFEFMLTFLDKLEEIVKLICAAITLGDLKKKSFKVNVKDKYDKSAEDYIKMANDIIDKNSWAIEELYSIIELLGNDKFITDTDDEKRLDLEAKISLDNMCTEFEKEYGVPISNNISDDNENEKEKSGFTDIISKIKANKTNLMNLATNIMSAGLDFLAGALPGYISTPISGGIDFAKDKIQSKLESLSNKKNEDGQNDSTDNSNTILLTKISNQINYIVGTVLDYFEANNAKEDSESRLCIFVDDLDRLNPSVALDLLEGLKNFAEFERCVFVLAIDKDVINQGLRSKYDESFIFGTEDSENTNDSRRTRADKFFDKIIQVPFDIPRKKYDIVKYMEKLLDRKYDFKIEDEPSAEDYAEFLGGLDIDNPRSIKRYYNLQMLYECMGGQETQLDGKSKRWYDFCFFVVTVIQIEDIGFYNSFYNEIVVFKTKEGNDRGLDEIKEMLKKEEDDNTFAAMLLHYLERVEEKCNNVVSKDDLAEWIRRIFTLSNYNQKLDTTQIYLRKFKKIAELLNSDEANSFDFSGYIEELNEAIYSNSEKIPHLDSYDGSLVMGMGSRTPYILLKNYNHRVGDFFARHNSFKVYEKDAQKRNDENYYIFNSRNNTITIYVTPTLEISDDLKALFRHIGLLSGSENRN